MEKFLKITWVNYRHNLLPHIAASLFLVLLAPFLMGTRNLEVYQTAKIVEVYLSLLGIILLIPVFTPDMNLDIRDLIRSKKEPMAVLHIIRLANALVVLAILGLLFLIFLKYGNCDFKMWKMLYAFLAESMFLGGMGLFIFALLDQIVLAYMLPMIYYIMNFGSGAKYLGKLYLFSMQAGSFAEKHYLMAAGIVLLALSVITRRLKP